VLYESFLHVTSTCAIVLLPSDINATDCAPSLIAAIVQQVVAQFDLPPWRPQIGVLARLTQGEQLAVKYDHMATFPET